MSRCQVAGGQGQGEFLRAECGPLCQAARGPSLSPCVNLASTPRSRGARPEGARGPGASCFSPSNQGVVGNGCPGPDDRTGGSQAPSAFRDPPGERNRSRSPQAMWLLSHVSLFKVTIPHAPILVGMRLVWPRVFPMRYKSPEDKRQEQSLQK